MRSRCMDIDELLGMFMDRGAIEVHKHTERIDAIAGICLKCYAFDNFNIPQAHYTCISSLCIWPSVCSYSGIELMFSIFYNNTQVAKI